VFQLRNRRSRQLAALLRDTARTAPPTCDLRSETTSLILAFGAMSLTNFAGHNDRATAYACAREEPAFFVTNGGQFAPLSQALVVCAARGISSFDDISSPGGQNAFRHCRDLNHRPLSSVRSPTAYPGAPRSRAGSSGGKRPGANGARSTRRASPSMISSPIASLVAGALSMPQTPWPVAT
jgi:hypothetical protein